MWPIALGLAFAQEAPGPAVTGAFHDELARAKAEVFEGDTAQALAILDALAERLDRGEKPPPQLAWEALVYRGDLHHARGDVDVARTCFRRVLLQDPDYVVSPYHHGGEVRALFALVREEVKRELAASAPDPVPEPVPVPLPITPPPPPPVVRHRLPMWGFAPFGVPQFRQRRPGAGAAYAATQGIALLASVGSYTWLVTINREPSGHPLGWQQDQVRRHVQTMRYGVQLPTTALFYGTWLLSVIDGAGTWKRDHRDHPVAIDLTIGPGALGVRGHF